MVLVELLLFVVVVLETVVLVTPEKFVPSVDNLSVLLLVFVEDEVFDDGVVFVVFVDVVLVVPDVEDEEEVFELVVVVVARSISPDCVQGMRWSVGSSRHRSTPTALQNVQVQFFSP